VQRGPGARVILAVFGLQVRVVVVEQLECLVGLTLVEQGLGGGHGQDAGMRPPAGQPFGEGGEERRGGSVAAGDPAQGEQFSGQGRGQGVGRGAGVVFDDAGQE